jgi:hypothetical protein
MSIDRDVWLADLAGTRAEPARAELLAHPEWLSGAPPAFFLDALIVAYLHALAPPLDVARAWARPAMAEALRDRLAREPDGEAQEALAWLLSQMPCALLTRDLVEWVTRPEQATIVRRWLATALDRLVFAGEIGWPDVADAVDALVNADEASLRQAAAGICGSFTREDAAHQVLLTLLDDVDIAVVESALQMLVLRGERLDTPRVRQLAGHPSAGVAERATRLLGG